MFKPDLILIPRLVNRPMTIFFLRLDEIIVIGGAMSHAQIPKIGRNREEVYTQLAIAQQYHSQLQSTRKYVYVRLLTEESRIICPVDRRSGRE